MNLKIGEFENKSVGESENKSVGAEDESEDKNKSDDESIIS